MKSILSQYWKYILFVVVAVFVGASVYGWIYYKRYYNYNYVEQVNKYYRITVYDKADIIQLPQYKNDSIAIAKESERYSELYKDCIDSITKYMAVQRNFEYGTPNYLKANVHIKAYTEILNESIVLMRISHIRKFDKEQLKKIKSIIIKKGVYSKETRQFIDRNKINVEFYTIKE